MNASEHKKLASIKKKFNCDLGDCIESLSFDILDTELKFVDKEKIKYRGRCTKCNASCVVSSKNIQLLERVFSKVNIIELKSNFDSLFDSNE